MKTRFKLFAVVLTLFIAQISNAQINPSLQFSSASVAEEKGNSTAKHKIDPQPILENIYKQIGFDPAKQELKTSLKKTAWNFQVGTPVSWWGQNLKTGANPVFYQVPSTCRAVGTNCYIFVEDAIWLQSVDANGIAKVLEAFDSKTPAGSINPNKGIYQNDVDVFGPPSNVDGDPKIIILIMDILDDYSPTSSGYVAGFHTTYNLGTSPNSNKAEMIYIDGKQNDLTDPAMLLDAMSTVAHEFQHCIHYNYIKSATTFFNECFSLSAELLNGYPIYGQSRFASEPNHYLLDWRTNTATVYNDYSRGARFGLYLIEQFGPQFFTKYLQNGKDGITGVNAATAALSSTRKFADILPDWFVANGLNNKAVNSFWGYTYANLPKMTVREHINPNVTYSGNIENYGSEYITFSGGKNLSIKFTDAKGYGIKVAAIKYGTGNPVVESVPMGTNYSVPDFGTTFSKVVFVVYYVDSGFLQWTAGYSYVASGTFQATTQEIMYDLTEPTGYLQLTPGDSVAVAFNGISGGKLDSIKIALRGILPIDGNIKTYSGGYPNTLGAKLLGNFTATSKLSAPPAANSNTGTDYPYPIPYPNWSKVDLRSANIDAGKSFVVEVPVGAAYPATNRVLSTYYASTTSYYSYAYKFGETPTWTFYGVSGKDGIIFLFLIRAYVTIGGTDIEGPVEILPSAFSLEQNYPNPFNPSTVISYSLPKQSRVQIKIYDAVGSEVRSLIDEEKSAGKYNIYWDGKNNNGSRVSSGVYFYKINAGEFTQSKKMMLVK